MVEDKALTAALSALNELIHSSPDEAFKRVKSDLISGLVAFMPQEILEFNQNVQLYVKQLETAQTAIFKGEIAEVRANYNDGFILASLIALHKQWSRDRTYKTELPLISQKIEDLMHNTENELIQQSCQTVLNDIIRMGVAEDATAALSVLKELVSINPDEAFQKVTSDLAFGLMAFKPQETLMISENVQSYITRLETAQHEIFNQSLADSRLMYNEGFILASLISLYRSWSGNVDFEGELTDFSRRIEELMQSTENEFIRQSCRNALQDLQELEAYISEQAEFFYVYLVQYYSTDFDPEFISNLILSNELPEIKVFGFLLGIYRNNRYLRDKLLELVDVDQILVVLSKVLEGIRKFSERALRADLRKLATDFVRAEQPTPN